MFSRSRTFDATSYAKLLESRAKPKERASSHTVLANSARKRFGTEPEISRLLWPRESSSDGPIRASSTSIADRTAWSQPGADSSSSPLPRILECQLCFEDLEHAERYQCRECPEVCLCSNCVINSSIVHSSDNGEHIFELSDGDGRGLQADRASSEVEATRPISGGSDHGSVGSDPARGDVDGPGTSDGSPSPGAATRISVACLDVASLGSNDDRGPSRLSTDNGAGDAIPRSMSPQWRGQPQMSTHHTQIQTRQTQRRKPFRPRPQSTPSRLPIPLAQEGIFEFLCRAADQYFQHQTSSIEARIERRIAKRIEQRIERRVMARLSRRLPNAPGEDGDGADNEHRLRDGSVEADGAGAENDLIHNDDDDDDDDLDNENENDNENDSDGGSSLDRILDFRDENLEPPRTGSPWLPRDKQQLRKLKGQGMTEKQIGLQLGRSPGAICQQWRKLRTRTRRKAGPAGGSLV